jgi:hypothetical protein
MFVEFIKLSIDPTVAERCVDRLGFFTVSICKLFLANLIQSPFESAGCAPSQPSSEAALAKAMIGKPKCSSLAT